MKFRQLAAGASIVAALMVGVADLPVMGESGAEHSHDDITAESRPEEGMSQEGMPHDQTSHDAMAEDVMADDAVEEMSHDQMSHDQMSHDSDHAHKQLEVSADQPVPSVELLVHEDALNGWNLEVQLENFEFSPTTVNEPGPQNEGHAHLYINGEKVTRLYSSWYYLGALEPGDNEIMVTLNTNVHEDLTVDGETIAASTVISVAE